MLECVNVLFASRELSVSKLFTIAVDFKIIPNALPSSAELYHSEFN